MSSRSRHQQRTSLKRAARSSASGTSCGANQLHSVSAEHRDKFVAENASSSLCKTRFRLVASSAYSIPVEDGQKQKFKALRGRTPSEIAGRS